MATRDGRFRVYRVTEAVPHLNLQAVESPVLYTVYQQGYTELQPAVDDLRTGDLVRATLSGDPGDEDEAWRLEAVEPVDHVAMGFAVDADPPALARDCWTAGQTEPECAVLTEEGAPVGACCVQPREGLPGGRFVPNVLAGLLPLEPQLGSVPGVGDPAAEALFIDPEPPGERNPTTPFGVVLLFTERASDLPDRFREAYDCPRETDSRPAFDPYGL
jgi:hypothetical protein